MDGAVDSFSKESAAKHFQKVYLILKTKMLKAWDKSRPTNTNHRQSRHALSHVPPHHQGRKRARV